MTWGAEVGGYDLGAEIVLPLASSGIDAVQVGHGGAVVGKEGAARSIMGLVRRAPETPMAVLFVKNSRRTLGRNVPGAVTGGAIESLSHSHGAIDTVPAS